MFFLVMCDTHRETSAVKMSFTDSISKMLFFVGWERKFGCAAHYYNEYIDCQYTCRPAERERGAPECNRQYCCHRLSKPCCKGSESDTPSAGGRWVQIALHVPRE